MKTKIKNLVILFSIMLTFGVISAGVSRAQGSTAIQTYVEDTHSYSNPQAVRVTNVDLDWTVLFDMKILQGVTTLTVERIDPNAPLVLDTRDLKIDTVVTSKDGRNFQVAKFKLGAADKILGAPLTIQLTADASVAKTS